MNLKTTKNPAPASGSSLFAGLVKLISPGSNGSRKRRQAGFCLEEVVMAMGIAAITIAGAGSAHVSAAKRAEFTACSWAANSAAVQRIEQVRAARWDTLASVDQVVAANFPTTVQALDIPHIAGAVVYGTNYTTITTVSIDPPVKAVRTDCVWNFLERGLFTNTVVVYRSPDQ
jgi:hypothetical protein